MSTDARGSTYRLVLRGELGDKFALAFEGMKLSRDGGNTVLTGPVVDQAQLAGIIGRVHELGLDLISVATVEPTTEPPVGAWER